MADVTCAIILSEENILVIQRSEKMNLSIKREFHGGKVKSFKTYKKCSLTEIKEKLNLEIVLLKKIESKFFPYYSISINLMPFIAKYPSVKIFLANILDFKWLTKEELLLLDLASADIPVLHDF